MVTRTTCTSNYMPTENPIFVGGSYRWFEIEWTQQIQWNIEKKCESIAEVKELFYQEMIEREKQTRDKLKPEFRSEFVFSTRENVLAY